jgi:YHS domain-containing protein
MKVRVVGIAGGLGLLALLLFVAGCGEEASSPGSGPGLEKPVEKTQEPAPVTLRPQETCPVMGGKIKRDVFVDFEGLRVYFCCAGCERTFLKSPERYLKVLERRGEEPVEVPSE